MTLAWVVAQGAWLGTAFQLEFMAREVYLPLWAAGLGLLGTSTWVLGEIIEGWREPDASAGSQRTKKDQ
jgi:phosphatidylinositol glycan class M